MDFPNDPAVLDIGDQFMFGPAFLVSPITTYKVTGRLVHFPATKGGWYELFSGRRERGGARVFVQAPLGTPPVFVRAGSIVPFGPELAHTSEKPADPIVLFVYGGADGNFELYEDDGATYAYEKGAFSRIPLVWNDATKTLRIGAREGTFAGMLGERTFHVVRIAKDKPVAFSFTPKPDVTVKYSGQALDVAVP
jgi:alpha-D-xyloside xylohydrolase